jgi:hypothetical protein
MMALNPESENRLAAFERFLAALHDGNWPVRARAAYALGRLGDPRGAATEHDESHSAMPQPFPPAAQPPSGGPPTPEEE